MTRLSLCAFYVTNIHSFSGFDVSVFVFVGLGLLNIVMSHLISDELWRSGRSDLNFA